MYINPKSFSLFFLNRPWWEKRGWGVTCRTTEAEKIKSNQINPAEHILSFSSDEFDEKDHWKTCRRYIKKPTYLPTYHPRSWSHRSWYKINTHTHTHLIIIIIIWLFFNITFIFQEHLKICSIHWVSFPTPASSLAIRLYMYRREQSDDFQRKGYRSTT